MPANFLHGVETLIVTAGARQIRGVKTAVIGLVGTAPIWEVDAENQKTNEPVLILSVQDAEKYFGTVRDGYTIPQALKAIFDQGKGIVVAVNVLDPATHKDSVALADHDLDDDDEYKSPHVGISNVVVKNAAGAVTYVLDTDYTVDAINGIIALKAGGAIASGATLKISYDFVQPTDVVAADIVGEVDESGNRTGLKALDDVYSLFGFNPKLLLAPAFCTQTTVAAELEARAVALRAIALIDAPIGTTLEDAIEGRGPDGAINFQTSSQRVVLCDPHCLIDDGAGGEVEDPLSSRIAGAIAAKDIDRGYHWSPSNTPILGIVGVERSLTSRINDSTSEINQLNEVGITTILNSFGTGFRIWGNRSAAYPSETGPEVFINIRRTADIIHESLELSMLQFIDMPIDDGLVDAIKESVNGFLRTLIGRGALVEGVCSYDPADNPEVEIAAGHLTFQIDFMPPVPAERITIKSFIDITMLRAVGAES